MNVGVLYQRTKVLAEQAVWDLIAKGMPITIVNPSTPIGAGDRRPTPTGRLIVDYLSGRLPAFLDTDLNWVSVEDVAMGHWLAAKEGHIGERYILGNANLSLSEFFKILADVSGKTGTQNAYTLFRSFNGRPCGESLWASDSTRTPSYTGWSTDGRSQHAI